MTSANATRTHEITADSTSRFVVTSRFRLHYHDAGAGRPLILLHGSGPGATGWSNFWPNIAPLAEHFRVLAVDMPGWGESDTQPGDQDRDHCLDVLAFMDALGLDRAALIGNSMGGGTAIGTAARFPERVSHLIAMGAAAPGNNVLSPAGLSEGLKTLLQAYRTPTPTAMRALVSIMCFDQAMASDELAELRSHAALARPEHLENFLSWISRLSASDPWHGAGPMIPAISAPTLVIHGREDRVLSYEGSLRLTTMIADSRLLLLNRCGHWAQIEHAKEFNRAVTDFVAAR